MNIIQLDKIEACTTQDCVILLTENVKDQRWVRSKKYHFENEEARVFVGEDTTVVTILCHGGGATLHVGLDLQDFDPVVKDLKKYAKRYWSLDGWGSIFFNPYQNSVWMSGGDRGIIYSEKKPKGDSDEFDQLPFTCISKLVPQLDHVTYEAEAEPKREDGYFFITDIKSLG